MGRGGGFYRSFLSYSIFHKWALTLAFHFMTFNFMYQPCAVVQICLVVITAAEVSQSDVLC